MAIAEYNDAKTAINFVRRSTDGGRTWSNVYGDTLKRDPIPANWHYPLRMFALAYPSPRLCLVACDSGVVLRSTDNGETWQRRYAFGRGYRGYMGNISMLDDLHGVSYTWQPDTTDFGTSGIAHTTDGGQSWQAMTPPSQPEAREGIGSPVYLAPGTIIGMTGVYASPDHTDIPKLYTVRTTNGGASWNVYNGPTYATNIRFVDSLHGFAYGNTQADFNGHWNDHFARTSDGGMTWTDTFDSTVGFNLGIHDMAFLDTLNGIAIGAGKIIRTTDGGMTWNEEGMRFEKNNHDYNAVAYPSAATILTATFEGNVYLFVPDPAGVDAPEIPAPGTAPRLFPNPARAGDRPRLGFTLSAPAAVRVDLVNARGETITTHDAGTIDAGAHLLELAPEIPAALPSGTYFARLVIGGPTGAKIHAVPFVVVH